MTFTSLNYQHSTAFSSKLISPNVSAQKSINWTLITFYTKAEIYHKKILEDVLNNYQARRTSGSSVSCIRCIPYLMHSCAIGLNTSAPTLRAIRDNVSITEKHLFHYIFLIVHRREEKSQLGDNLTFLE